MPLSYPWHLWPGRHWPCTAAEEAAFVATLESHGDSPTFERGDVTSVLNMLRCNTSLDDLADVAPGLRPARLAAAYRHLQERLAAGRESWAAIVADPHVATITHHGPAAVALLPGLEDPLFRARTVFGPDHYPATVARLAGVVDDCATHATSLEATLVELVASERYDAAVAFGKRLYDPYEGGMWAHPLYLPTRVGALMPLRVSDLLEERRG